MENNIDLLRESIKSNPNLSDDFKCNLATLTDTLVTVYPGFDYSSFATKLSSLKITSGDTPEYLNYDNENNLITLNVVKTFEDRVDLQHLMLNGILRMKTCDDPAISSLIGYYNGLSELVSSKMNSDESMKKLYALESTALGIFSKIVDPSILLESYNVGNINPVVEQLQSYGISDDEITSLFNSLNNISNPNIENNTSFADAEVSMIGMFSKRIDSDLRCGISSFDDIKERYDDFSTLLVFNRSELISIYPHHDFSNMNGFERIKDVLDDAIINSEIIEVDEMKK